MDVPQRHILGWKAIHTWNGAYQLLGHFVKESETMSSRVFSYDSWIVCSSIGIGIRTVVRTDKPGVYHLAQEEFLLAQERPVR